LVDLIEKMVFRLSGVLLVIHSDLQKPNDATSQNLLPPFVSHSRGQERINLRAALEAPSDLKNSKLTFGEVLRVFLGTHYNGADMHKRKCIDLLVE
jgi:hypothetical protein